MKNHNSWDENNNTDELDEYKKNLAKSLKAQAALVKELSLVKLNQNKDQKKYNDEKTELTFQIGQLTAYAEKLESDLITAHAELTTLKEQNKNLALALERQSSSGNPSSATEVQEEAPVQVSENATSSTSSMIKAADKNKSASSYNLWGLLGYNQPKNQAHEPLADLTKVSVEQAIRESRVTRS